MEPALKTFLDRHTARSMGKAIGAIAFAFVVVELAAFLLTNSGDSAVGHLGRTLKLSVPVTAIVALFAFGNHWIGVKLLSSMFSAPQTIRWAYAATEISRTGGRPTGKRMLEIWDSTGRVAHLTVDDLEGALAELARRPEVMIGYGSAEKARYEALVAAGKNTQ